METETRLVLSSAAAAQGFGAAWLELAAEHQDDELFPPVRSLPRDIDFW